MTRRPALLWFFLLPLALFGLTYLGLGCFYETNDDQIITLLLRGVTIQPAQEDLGLYFHGLADFLAWLYRVWPTWPWYGLFLYAGLLVATGLSFYLIQKAFPNLSRGKLLGLLAGFYFFIWSEHVMWFNYLRVPLLLAGITFLVVLSRVRQRGKGQTWVFLGGGALFLLALAIRPSGALLGFLVVAPVAFLLPGVGEGQGAGLKPLAVFLILAGGFMLLIRQTHTPAETAYARLDLYKSAILDYEIYEARLTTPQDSLAYQAVQHWFLADTEVINLEFFQSKGSINASYLLLKAGPRKIRELAGVLVRDHFLVLFLNAALILAACNRYQGRTRKKLLAYHFYFWLLLMGIGWCLKLPPRVLTPCLDLYTLAHGMLITGGNSFPGFKFPRWSLYLLLLLVLLQTAKTGHRSYRQRQRQLNQEFMLARINQVSRGKVLVSSVLPDYFRSLSPFRNYNFSAKTIVALTGWNTIDPAYGKYYLDLTGTRKFTEVVPALIRRKDTVWLLSPDFSRFLKRYYRNLYRENINLKSKQPGLGIIQPGEVPYQENFPDLPENGKK